jgi:hypothetical protein
MQVIKSLGNLLEESAADALLDLPIRALLFDILVQRYAFNVISNQAYLLASFNYIVHSDYVWVINFLKCHYFTLDCLPLHGII